MKFLNELKVGEKAKIININNSSIKRRLMDIGLIENSIVECALESPFKDPKAYLIKGALIAIRNKDAINIMVQNYE